MSQPVVLVTGAAGGLGRELRRRFRGTVPHLRLSDVVDMEPAGPGEEVAEYTAIRINGRMRYCHVLHQQRDFVQN